jgi:TolA-binding protein
MQGECQFKLQNHQLALASFQEATKRRLSSGQMEVLARLHAGQTAGQLGQWQQSLKWLETLPQKYPDSPYLPQALYETGVARQKLGDLDQAVKLFTEAADQASGELSARARFMVGEALYAKKEYVAAIREFRKVLFGFDSQASPEIKRWQAKAGLEAGQCAGVLASQQANPTERRRITNLARQLLRQVQSRYPSTEEAAAATEQLRRYGG